MRSLSILVTARFTNPSLSEDCNGGTEFPITSLASEGNEHQVVGRTKERIRRSARTAEHGARASKCVRVGHRDGAERDCFKDASPKMLLVRRAGRLLRLFVHLRLNVGRPNRYILTRYIKENSAIRSLPTTSKAQPTQRLCSPPAPHYNDLCINDPVMTRSEQHSNKNHMG